MRMRMVKNYKTYRVLKLVHPGGLVEIHQKPITADEVMKKNPRHCVTRPDVFKYPWIVVRPESVLKPGSVFYIVPFHTIHGLMQRSRCPYQKYLFQQQDLAHSSVELTYYHQFVMQQSPDMSQTRTKVDCKIKRRPDDALFPKSLIRNKKCLEPEQCQQSLIKSPFSLEYFVDSPSKLYLADHWPTASDHENLAEFEQQVSSFIEPRPAFSLDFVSDGASIGVASPPRPAFSLDFAPDGASIGVASPPRPAFSLDFASDGASNDVAFPRIDSELGPNSSKESQPLKSCLKKHNQGGSRGLRVTFALPD